MSIEDLLNSNHVVVAKTIPVEQDTVIDGPFKIHSSCKGEWRTEPVIQLPAIKDLSLADARKLAEFLISVCDQYEQ